MKRSSRASGAIDTRAIAIERRVHSAVPRAKPQTPTVHGSATLAFYTGGRARVEQDGEWQVGAGDILLVPAGTPHRLLETHAAECWRVTFYAPCLAPGGAVLLEPLERVRDGASAVARIPAARQSHLQGLLVELDRVGRGSGARREYIDSVERSLLTLVLAEIADATSAEPPGGRSSVVTQALRVIERRCLGPLGLAEVARAVDRSPAYVTTAVSRATGRSVVQWIVSARMAEARRLLQHSEANIDSIAERVGYADSTHFTRMFRRAHGSTPAAWRAAQRLSASSR